MEKILNHYEVNDRTMALLPAYHTDYETIALEPGQKLYVKEKPFHLIKQACLRGLSSYEGRRAAMIYHIGPQHKIPIAIDPFKNIFSFPTHSPTLFECSWIFYHHVVGVKPDYSEGRNKKSSIIIFKNGEQLKMSDSHYKLEKQMLRTATCVLKFSHSDYYDVSS